VACGAALAGLPGRATVGARTTADEPQYLLTALSLATDGDLDIADELAARRWRAFHEADLPQQARALPGGVRISPHDPLLPILLVPGVALAGWQGAKVTLALVAGALAALLAWTAIARLGVAPPVAGLVTVVFAAALPLAAYGTQVYPELPAALAVTAALAVLLAPVRPPGAAVVVAACCALPWLGIKYAPVAAVLVGVLLWQLQRGGRRGAVGAVLAVCGAAGVVYVVVHQHIWTGWTVYASADHFGESGQLGVVGFSPDYWARTTRLAGLLIERTFGIAAWQPAWLVVVPAAAAALRFRSGQTMLLVAVLAVGWLTAAYVALTMAGWWMPGRQIVVVLPAAVLLCAWWAGRHRAAALAIGALGVLAWLVLAWEAATGRVTLVFDFYATGNPVYRAWRVLLPDYLAPVAGTWWRHAAWLVVLAVLAAFGWRSTPPRSGVEADDREPPRELGAPQDAPGSPSRWRRW
jgi:hypothetical protein